MLSRFYLIFIMSTTGFALSTTTGRAEQIYASPLCYRMCTVAFPAGRSTCSPLICASSQEHETP